MKTHKYVLTIEFESERPIKATPSRLTQFENGLCYLVEPSTGAYSIEETYVYGTGKSKLKKVVKKVGKK